MTREEFRSSVHKKQRWERFPGYVLFLFPSLFSLLFLGDTFVDYIQQPESAFTITVAFVLAVFSALFAWWGIRRMKRTFRTFILVKLDRTQITPDELIKLIIERLNYRKTRSNSELIKLRSDGWQTDHEIYIASNEDELFIDLRQDENYGLFTWITRSLKKRLVNEIIVIGNERQIHIKVEMNAK